MRPVRLVLLMALGALAAAPSGAQAAAPLIGQWSLDGAYEDGASSAVTDASGAGLDLKAPAGTIRVGKPSKFGSAALLPANSSVLRVDSPILAPAQVTLLAWVKQTGAAPLLRYIAGRGDDGPGTCLGSSYALYTGYPGFGGLHFYVRTATTPGPSSVITPVISDAAWTDGKWHLVTGTFDGLKARLYIDGALASESPDAATAPIQYALGGGTSFYVDGYPQSPCGLGDFPGAIDEVRLYDRALSISEIGRLSAAAGPDAPSLITDASLIPPVPAPTTPAPPPPPTAAAAAKSAAPIESAAIAKAASEVLGASKASLSTQMQKAVETSQAQVVEALKGASAASQIGAAQEVKDLEAKEARKIKANEQLQDRLEAMKYGIAAEVQAKAGQVVEAVATLTLEKKSAGKVKTQAITLPSSVGVAEAAAAGAAQSVPVQFPVDAKATAALTKGDIAKASITIQAAALDSLAEMSETDQLKLQQAMDRKSKSFELLSNLMKKLEETQQTIAANVRGGETKQEQKENKQLRDKAAKIEKDARAIETAMNEAQNKADEAMQAAVAGMVTGIVAGAVQVGSAAAAGSVPGGIPTGNPNQIIPPDAFLKQLPASTASLKGCRAPCPYAITTEGASK